MIEDADYAGTTEEEVKTALAEWTDCRKQLLAYIKADDYRHKLPSAPVSQYCFLALTKEIPASY